MSWSPGRCCEVCLAERQVKNCYCLMAFRGGSSGSRTGYPAAISNRSRHAMIHAFKVQRRSAVGRSRAGQRSGGVHARPARRHRVVVSVDVRARPGPVSWSPAVPRTTGASSSSWRRFNDQDGRGSSLTRWSSCPRLSLLGSKMLSEPETAAGHPPHTLDPIFVLVGEG